MNRTHTLTVAGLLCLASLSAVMGCGGMDDMMPNPPSELKVMALEGGAHLTWKDNSDNEASFMVERKVGSDSFKTLTSVPFDTTAYHDPSLTSGMMYTYRVMAMPKTGAHDSAKYSNEGSFTAP